MADPLDRLGLARNSQDHLADLQVLDRLFAVSGQDLRALQKAMGPATAATAMTVTIVSPQCPGGCQHCQEAAKNRDGGDEMPSRRRNARSSGWRYINTSRIKVTHYSTPTTTRP